MKTLILDGGSETDVATAAAALRRGEVVAFPTETVYGLGADARSNEAVGKVFHAKGRPADNPLIVHMASLEALVEADFVESMSPAVYRLAEHFWPGPLTLVLPLRRREESSSLSSLSPHVTISRLVTAGLNTVAVRVPKHPVACTLLAAAGLPVAAPSANSSGRPSPTTAGHVQRDLDGSIYAILDGGEVNIGIESTVLDTTSALLTILRPGAITRYLARTAPNSHAL